MRHFVVPPIARRHGHFFVKAAVTWAEMVFEDRAHLQIERRDRNHNLIRPALPQLLERPLRGETAKQLASRRADFLQAFLAVLLVQLAYTAYQSKEILEPDHELAKRDRFLSLRRLAVEAELVGEDYKPGDPGDRVERVLRLQRRIGIISKTIQWRARTSRGKSQSRAALRRVSFKQLLLLGGPLARAARRVNRINTKAADERKAAELKDQARAAVADEPSPPTEADPPFVGRIRGQPDAAIADAVAADHPDWDIKAINDEARRLEKLLELGAGDDDDDDTS